MYCLNRLIEESVKNVMDRKNNSVQQKRNGNSFKRRFNTHFDTVFFRCKNSNKQKFIHRAKTMKINDKVITPDGIGTITGIDLPESRASRFIVKLDKSIFSFNPCYFQSELKSI